MQTLTRPSNRGVNIVQPIEIRKTAMLNSILLSSHSNDMPSTSTASAVVMTAAAAVAASSTTTTTPADALSPSVASSSINPFDESFSKSIQAQISNNAASSSIGTSQQMSPPPITTPTTTTRSTSSYISRQPSVPSTSSSSSNGSVIARSSSTVSSPIISVNNQINLKQTHRIGKYILFDVLTANQQQQQQQQVSTQNDLMFNIALNLTDKQTYYWRKIAACEYGKKLQPYYLMDSSEYVYRFNELILDTRDAYLFFQPHHGDLHSYMKDKKRLKESEAKSLFYQIVQVVKQCHENGIIVRDIKLKKFVFSDVEKTKIALTNLEDCLVLEDADNDLIKSQQGCPAYVSPEVLNPSQTHYSGKLSDSWSLGIVLYTLLFGRYPFHHNTITTMFAKIAKGKFQIPTNGISLDAKILLRSLIRLNPSERLLPDEIMKSNWFKDFSMNDYKNIYEINKLINDTKNVRSANDTSSSSNSHNSNESNYFAREYLMETTNRYNSNLHNNNGDEQFVPNF